MLEFLSFVGFHNKGTRIYSRILIWTETYFMSIFRHEAPAMGAVSVLVLKKILIRLN